ncbi:MAG: lipoyl(octanoyl) transferase LipB [Desulfomonilaceae bacterium]|nr:lipoyl(octanoyl) transferase LipB [Desulfomonilaceae bacterium]
MLCIDLPLTDYSHALNIQNEIIKRMLTEDCPDVLVLVEHPPTVTLGVRGTTSDLLIPEHELRRRGVTVYTVNRGGEATYHGPGQLVVYPLVNLKTRMLSARDYVNGLEETILRSLKCFSVRGFRKKGAAGVWIDEESKIASIGVRIQRRVTSHGFSLNVSSSDPGDMIVSCGNPGIRMVSLNDFIPFPASMDSVREAVKSSFEEVFRVGLDEHSLEQLRATFAPHVDGRNRT